MNIEVKGHSGCQIEIVREGKRLYVVKSTRDPKYVQRLENQAIKQANAARWEYQFVRVPSIVEQHRGKGMFEMKMEYVYSKNFIDFFETAGFEQIHYTVQALTKFVDREISFSPLAKVARDVVMAKFQDVCTNCEATFNRNIHAPAVKELLGRCAEVFRALPETLTLPVGLCHGDLTFSNILFNGNNCFLIDFLDSFIETPLMDMVKLRQDTCYRWSPLMYSKPYDATRLDIICQEIDRQLDLHFSRYDWYRAYYRPMQLMNFLRILQYAKEEKVITYLIATVDAMLIAGGEEPATVLPIIEEKPATGQGRAIIVPVAADKPEYEHQMPYLFHFGDDGLMLCVKAIMGLNLVDYDKICFSILRKHSERFSLNELFRIQFRHLGIEDKAQVVELEEPTANQCETLYRTIVQTDIKGAVLFKDADCHFKMDTPTENGVAIYPLDALSRVNPRDKSYVVVDDMYYITNIIEKRILERNFCAGGYYFENVALFKAEYERLRESPSLYLSHIIYSLLLQQTTFRPLQIEHYKDWGTYRDYIENKRNDG